MFLMGGIHPVTPGVLGNHVGHTCVESQKRPLHVIGLARTSAMRADSPPPPDRAADLLVASTR